MSTDDRIRKRRVAEELREPAREARRLARKLGLDPFEVNYWIVDHDEMNELIAYGGFQRRYPHWRWGMSYDRQRKQRQFLGGKAFEIVNNDDPSNAFLQESNDRADQKAVITHVEAHADFFRNNEWFRMFGTDPDAAAMLERHADAIAEYMDDPEISREDIEEWIDHALCLEDNIDQHRPFTGALDRNGGEVVPADLDEELGDFELSEEVRREVFDDEWLEAMSEDEDGAQFPADPERDVIAFLIAHGKAYDEESGKAVEYEEWQRDILELLRKEAYYFAPQKMTKVMNEGWACVAPETPVFTAEGLIEMQEVVNSSVPVSDGQTERAVYDSNIIHEHETVTVRTRRGFELTGSNNHRIRRSDGSWIRLDELEVGDSIETSGGNDLWPEEYVDLQWTAPARATLEDVAEEAGVSARTVLRYRRTGSAPRADVIESALNSYRGPDQSVSMRDEILTPDAVREPLGRFLGLFVGDGYVSEAAGQVGFTSDSGEQAEEFAGLFAELFGIDPEIRRDGSRWHVTVFSRNFIKFLAEAIGLLTDETTVEKTVPEVVCRSPKSVVAEFLRGLFDADGYASEQGILLSTKSNNLSSTVQLLLSNFGTLSRREQTDGCYHVHLTGRSASVFNEEIGFGYPTKSEALDAYLNDLSGVEEERWTDEIVEIETGSGTVYDISVEETHRYAAGGLVNHNSYWESKMMAGETFAGDDEFLSYADHMAQVLGSSGLNPYKLGFEFWQYIENRRNRREVIEQLLRVEGITWRNLEDAIDFDAVLESLEPDPVVTDPVGHLKDLDPDDPRIDTETLTRVRDGEEISIRTYPWKLLTYEGLAERHYSLTKPSHRGFLGRVSKSELERTARYLFDTDRYDSVEAAVDEVDRTAGWDRMFEVRESHNDVTFLDEFLTDEFVDENDYFTYEYTHTTRDFRATSTEAEDVKKKLMLQFTNFGKPTIAVTDGNFRNRNELLLAHQYNGVELDIEQAKRTLERIFELWGRPVALKTIRKTFDDRDIEIARRRDREPEPTERGVLIRFDGEAFEEEELSDAEVADITATDVDYDTKPDEWT